MEQIIKWIKEERSHGTSWDKLYLAGEDSEDDLVYFLKFNAKKNHWPLLSATEWHDIVELERKRSEEVEILIDEKGATVIGGQNEKNVLTVPMGEDSAWQTYRRQLARIGFGERTVDLIEDAAIKTLRCLSSKTREIGAVKGLIIGNVQSGKTANMAALIAMAADSGWNMFVVLSGMMNNLRHQTQCRLISDLRDSKWDWESISNPTKVEEDGKKLRDKKLEKDSKKRYLLVCIKNTKRLENLIEWMFYNQSPRENIRMLVIDDECDQASINTSMEEERTKINKRILDLINNRSTKGKMATVPFQAVNYIGYTATPYANVLNEGPGEESLYPKDFITALCVSDEYFGPQQIFGYDGEESNDNISFSGIDIVRNISDEEILELNDLQDGDFRFLPNSLITSICWFVCGVACMRRCDYKKPVSMLIHTSRKVNHHRNLSNAINQWFTSNSVDRIINICREVWEKETARFSLNEFRKSYPTYSASNGGKEITDYPLFDEIQPFIKTILNIGLSNILVNDENSRKEYTDGIHLCVDNSEKIDDNRIIGRLVYPEDDEMPELAPAFLVIGGNTLSRGLTLEGLISTYFLRPSKCADTLMQMGRWFGYRSGYELLPRIWMTRNVRDQFEFISNMDQRLRDEIRLMSKIGVSPADCGPKIMASPSAKWLQIVSKNKQQSAIGAEYDFAGHTIETGVFDNKMETLQENMIKTRAFLLSLGEPTILVDNPYVDRNILWKGISWDYIKKYLKNYHYSSRLKGLNELDAFTGWMDKMTEIGYLGNWNVILAGVLNSKENKKWVLSDRLSINMVNRTQKTPGRLDGVLNIGVLRSFNDFLSDIDTSQNEGKSLNMQELDHSIAALNSVREKFGLGRTPQLIIYIIDKDSMPQIGATKRFPLNAVADVVGFSINIPGYRNTRNTIQSIRINITPVNSFED